MTETAFGNIVSVTRIEKAILEVLQEWFPTYLREIERQEEWEGRPLPSPKNYTRRNSFDSEKGEKVPKVVVVSPGLYEPPETLESDGYYKATWQVGVGIATVGRTEEEADERAKMYAAAARAIIEQQLIPAEESICYVEWLDENYEDLPVDDKIQQYRSAGAYFAVGVEKAVNMFMRPSTPDETAEDLVTVNEVITTVTVID